MTDIAVIGSGTMGNGIAHVFAQHGHAVVLIDVNQAALDKALVTIKGNLDRQVEERDDRPRGAGPGPRPHRHRHRSRARPRRRAGDRGCERESRRQVRPLHPARPALRPGGDPRDQHLVDLDHRDRRQDGAPGAGDRDALHEPGAGDAARRGHPRVCHERRHDHDGASRSRPPWARRRSRSTTPGFVANRILMPMINEAIFASTSRSRVRRRSTP